MIKNCSRILSFSLSAALILQSVGCGTILYPNRKGQKSGQIDVAVAALDAVGLLFMIIPGVIAFAVDFNNGAIYLPRGEKGLLNLNDLQKLRFNPHSDAKARVEKILREKTGLDIRLGQSNMEIFKLKSLNDLPARFAAVSALSKTRRVASALPRSADKALF